MQHSGYIMQHSPVCVSDAARCNQRDPPSSGCNGGICSHGVNKGRGGGAVDPWTSPTAPRAGKRPTSIMRLGCRSRTGREPSTSARQVRLTLGLRLHTSRWARVCGCIAPCMDPLPSPPPPAPDSLSAVHLPPGAGAWVVVRACTLPSPRPGDLRLPYIPTHPPPPGNAHGLWAAGDSTH